MSQAKHKSYRKVLAIHKTTWKQGLVNVPVTHVVWCIVSRATSKSVYSEHLAVSTYVGGYKFNGITARMPRKASRVDLKNVEANEYISAMLERNDGFNEAALRYLAREGESKRFAGKVKFCTSSGFGMLTCEQNGLDFHFYVCNFTTANSPYAELVTNITVKQGDYLSFSLHSDPYVTKSCGAISLERLTA